MNTTIEPKPLTSPWDIAKDIASWLPAKDAAIAERVIERHEREHQQAERVAKLLSEPNSHTRM